MFYLGLDLGQRRDHSAIVVVQKKPLVFQYEDQKTQLLLVRLVERIPLGTSYPAVVDKVQNLLQHRELLGQCSLVVDATGVGAPVVEMLRAARLGCEISPVIITGGDRQNSSYAAGGVVWNVPKCDLISGLQLLLERGELKIAEHMRDRPLLVRELLDMRVTMGSHGRTKLASSDKSHDDLVIALALACWRAHRKHVTFGSRRLPGL